ncbi:hypothetical protein AVEN_26786-1 [Araneus ventricosus]|uniref:Uncharacterized protein n=1 Tax=Araneus ventricosus TaxID=182803 RepID=A0A4Y2D518_ARAVE|nr:hypothetical protein AVEN_26786-1 [Araneus ventricosus]
MKGEEKEWSISVSFRCTVILRGKRQMRKNIGFRFDTGCFKQGVVLPLVVGMQRIVVAEESLESFDRCSYIKGQRFDG